MLGLARGQAFDKVTWARFNDANDPVGWEYSNPVSAEFGGEHDAEQEAEQEALNALVALLDQAAECAIKALDAGDLERWRAQTRQIDRLDPGMVHHEDLKQLESAACEMQPVRIAVLHHPLSPLPAAPEIARMSGVLNAGEVKATLLRNKFCLVLHGHQHQGWIAREAWPGLHDDRALHIAAAPSLGSTETSDRNGFNEIRIYREGDERYQIEVLRYSWKGQTWAEDSSPVCFDWLVA